MYNLPLLLVVIIESPPLLMGVILEYTSYAVKRTHQLKLVGFEGIKKQVVQPVFVFNKCIFISTIAFSPISPTPLATAKQ